MEYGLRLTSPAVPPRDPRDACPAAWQMLLPDGPAVALYFGTEFCEDLLPDLAEAEAFCSMARDHDLEPTLLTPLVTPAGLRTVGRLVAELTMHGWEPAIVFNDWGVLGLLRDLHPALPRRAGRLMNRSLRDPRAYRDRAAGAATHDPSRYAKLRGLLAGLGVSAVETDMDLDGGYLGDGRNEAGVGLFRAVHLPFTFAASGRGCPLKARFYPEGGGFSKALADRCPGACRAGPIRVRREDCPMPLWRGGNTLFYEMPPEAAEAWLLRTDRVVLHEAAAP